MLIIRRPLQKEFASKSELRDINKAIEFQSAGLCKELLKILIMNADGEDVSHWLGDMIVNKYIKECISAGVKNNFPIIPGLLFIQLDNQNSLAGLKTISDTLKDNLPKMKLSDEFVASCITAIKTDRAYGNNKYAERPDVKGVNEKDKKTLDKYKSCLKLVALSLTGQINPKNFDPFTEFYKVSKLQIDYSKGDLRTLKLPEIRKTIAQALCQGMFYYEIEPSKELLDESGLYD